MLYDSEAIGTFFWIMIANRSKVETKILMFFLVNNLSHMPMLTKIS